MAQEKRDPVEVNYMRVRAELEKVDEQISKFKAQREGLMLALNVMDTKSPQLDFGQPSEDERRP